jgi:prevent-host-death family protein
MAATKTVSINEAEAHLSELLELVEQGADVIIARAGQPIAKISALERPKPRDRVPGTGKGLIELMPDFDAPLPPDIQRYFDGESDNDE